MRMCVCVCVCVCAVETVIHPEFHFGHNFTYDVALLRLPEPVHQFPVVTLNSAPGGAYSAISPGQNVTILGWGITETGLAQTLREGTVPLVPRTTCSEISAFQKAQAPITSTMVCAGQQLPPPGQEWPALPPVDACQGDSGGPMIAQGSSASGDVQLGIVSFGIGCAQPGVPGVYTDVVSVKAFIDSTVQQFSAHLSPSPPSSPFSSSAGSSHGGSAVQARSGYEG
jgi:secreted trypsin-like serine protease